METNMSELLELKEHYEKQVHLKQLLDRLYKNNDFRRLILQNYCVNECARYVRLSVSDTLDQSLSQKALEASKAAGYLHEYFNTVTRLGLHAEQELEQVKQEIESFGDVNDDN